MMTSHGTAKPAPVADWVTIPALYRDPFPIFERLRAEGGVHWVPAVNRYLITSYEAVSITEHDQETFSANEEGSLQIRAMGHSMLRRDDPEHYAERRAWQPALTPGKVKRVWTGMFREVAESLLPQLVEKGSEADLIWDFAAPYAAETLRRIIGLYNVTQEQMQFWSQALIDATGNYADDPDVWARGEKAFNEVDDALDEMLAYHMRHRDESLLSGLLSMPGPLMPIEKIRANVKMTIGGGLNEPRDALGVASWAMLSNPAQRQQAENDPALWHTVFDEAIRWIAPIGMYSRQTTRDVELCGVMLPRGAKLGICVLSANRDENVWNAPERFDINREVKPHLAFSKGVHVCLGSWTARAQIADVALPLLFSSLRGLEIAANRPVEVGGWVFRGMLKLPISWQKYEGPKYSTQIAAVAKPGANDSAGADSSAPEKRFAIVGAGPAGCFTAKELLKQVPHATIDVFDRLPVPFGLLRYGVAGDHLGTKSVARQFEQTINNPNVNFYGNTEVGKDIQLSELRANYHAVVLAAGLQNDRELSVPGADLQGVYKAGKITRLLNGHPGERETQLAVTSTVAPELGKNLVIVGNGNVAMDIVRLLVTESADLTRSAVNLAAHTTMTKDLRQIDVVGRGAATDAKFDPVMLRELSRLPGVLHKLHGVNFAAYEPGKDARLDALAELPQDVASPRTVVNWWFETIPVEFTGTAGLVQGISVQTSAGQQIIACDSVVSAVGFTWSEADFTQFGLCPHAVSGGSAEAAASSDGKIASGLYAIGWFKSGGRGTIPDQRVDAKHLVQLITGDLLREDAAANCPVHEAGKTCAAAKAGVVPPNKAVDKNGWLRIKAREESGGEGLESFARMCEVATDESIVPAVSAISDAGLHTAKRISILYGTESGNAELVAGELAELLHSDSGATVRDLAQITPSELERDTCYLVVCSTYGDGDVPSSAQGFYSLLRSQKQDLHGIRFAMFGLGDANYTRTYSRGSELLAEAFESCGATRFGEYGRHDAGSGVSASAAAEEWVSGVLAEINSLN